MTDIPTALEDAQAHLAAVLLQTVPTDDAIMMGHVHAAHAILRTVRRQLADPPRYVPGSSGPHPRPSYHTQARGIPSPAMQGEDVLPDDAPDFTKWKGAFHPFDVDALNGDDGSDAA